MALITKILTNVEGTFARILRDTDTDEFVVKFYDRGQLLKNANYYTDDEGDAIGTARAELSRMDGVEVADSVL
ncbi:MAG: hypothetical protein E6R03_18025 [Hyphomicrobiaceae bacterium]|nr:MAG: hypothetical protein E6R03_18025 [Hyphomicrobiaceae bacterium]